MKIIAYIFYAFAIWTAYTTATVWYHHLSYLWFSEVVEGKVIAIEAKVSKGDGSRMNLHDNLAVFMTLAYPCGEPSPCEAEYIGACALGDPDCDGVVGDTKFVRFVPPDNHRWVSDADRVQTTNSGQTIYQMTIWFRGFLPVVLFIFGWVCVNFGKKS